MIDTHVLNRGERGVRSLADVLTQGLNPSQLYINGTMQIGISSRRPCALEILDKPVISDENRAIV
jgi:hypothetical protein